MWITVEGCEYSQKRADSLIARLFAFRFACLVGPVVEGYAEAVFVVAHLAEPSDWPMGGSVSGQDPDEHLLTPSEVAALFRVDPKTVTRWAKAGKLTSIRTLGGHRRYRSSEVHALLDAQSPTTSQQISPHAPPTGGYPAR